MEDHKTEAEPQPDRKVRVLTEAERQELTTKALIEDALRMQTACDD